MQPNALTVLTSLSMSRPNILIADDDKVFVQFASSRLKGEGFNVVAASDAMQAVMTAMKTPVHGVLLDIQMPSGTGIEVLKRLKSSTKTQLIPVFVVSASNDPEMPSTAKTLGAEEFFAKPLDIDLLISRLRAVCA